MCVSKAVVWFVYVNTALDLATNVIYVCSDDKGLKSIESSFPFCIPLSPVLYPSLSQFSYPNSFVPLSLGWIRICISGLDRSQETNTDDLEKRKTLDSPTYRVFGFSFRCAAVTVIQDNSLADRRSLIPLCARHRFILVI